MLGNLQVNILGYSNHVRFECTKAGKVDLEQVVEKLEAWRLRIYFIMYRCIMSHVLKFVT